VVGTKQDYNQSCIDVCVYKKEETPLLFILGIIIFGH